jgi:hypothetical protein
MSAKQRSQKKINKIIKTQFMSDKKNNSGSQGTDNTTTKNKGESQQSKQKGAPSVSNKDTGKHTKDESHGAEENTTKKQQNSI